MDYATVLTHPIRFDQMPEKFVVPFGTAEEGGYAFTLMSERTSSTRGLGVYALQGRYGVAFIPRAGALRPVALREVSPLEFEEAAATTLGMNLGSTISSPLSRILQWFFSSIARAVLLVPIARDLMVYKRVHPVYIWVGGLIVALDVIDQSTSFFHNAAWLRLARWLLGEA
jgi:hypothetical protein